MSDDLKWKMWKIVAEELEDRGIFLKESLVLKALQAAFDRIAALQPEPPKDCIYREGGCCCDCDKAPCDQMPKFSKPKAERVEEVAEILDSTQSWARYQTGQEKFFRELAERIVDSEPISVSCVLAP